MTPREALDRVKEMADEHTEEWGPSKARDEAVQVLERLVAKDEADRSIAAAQQRDAHTLRRLEARAAGAVCTCGMTIPCAVWGHS